MNQNSALAILGSERDALLLVLTWRMMETKLELKPYCIFILCSKFVIRFLFFSVFCDHVHAFLNKMW